ncbi:MAG: pentapeptide repeat-containing protein, partial [Cyanobacteria bacterium J06626_4]
MLAFERQELFDTLSALPSGQFGAISFALNPPSGIIPDDTAAQGKRVETLLNWAEGPTGVGLQAVQEVLYQTLGKTAPSQTAICPYKGLSYFDCNDHDYQYFYGREALTQTLLEKVEQENFLAIVGASGSGKSSVLRAGLLQQFKDRGDSEIRLLVPGEQPLQNLGLAFVDETLERLERAHQLQTVDELMRKGATGLASLVRTSPQNRVVLVVDQFEEAFTLCHDPTERQTFFATLLGALAATDRLRLILAMRSDFVGKCFEADYSGLATQVKTHLEPVLPMSPAELTQAITAPARQVGISLEPGLVEALLKDVDPTSGSLPLLQYTLTELWQRQQDHQLKLSTYMQLGGVTGTLQQRADTIYAALTPDQQHTARHIFLSLTQLGEGAEDTRRRITQDSLISAQHPEAQVVAVVKRLADANLVVTDERTLEGGERRAIVDVAHEALIRNWPQLRTWLDENRDLLRQHRKIEQAAAEWSQQTRKQQKRYLLEGRQLSDARRFQKQHNAELPISEQGETYLSKSLTHRRNNRLKLTIAGLVIPLALSSYAGVHAATYFRLRPHWDVVYAYDPDNNKIGNVPLRRALREIKDAGRSLRRVSLSFADLSDADLSNANFSNAHLGGADLSDAHLGGADLSDAHLGGADLSDAHLSNADLSDADLSN